MSLKIQIDGNAVPLNLDCWFCSPGNTTTYEWRTGRVPDVVAEINPSSLVSVETASDDQIDFGDSAADEATSLASTSQSNGDFVHLEQIDFGAEADDNISWDISVQDDGSGNNAAGNGASSGELFIEVALISSPNDKMIFKVELS